MEPLVALAIATAAYAVILGLTYLFLLWKSPPAHRRPRKSELAVLVAIPLLFLALGYLLLKGLF
ncbi:MAG: hypothetical protein QXP31_02255 [Pyrobaculum sp.]